LIIGQAIFATVSRADVPATRTIPLKLLVAVSVFGLWFYAWYRNDQRRLTRDYSYPNPFDGILEKCMIRFPTDEVKTDCVLGANSEGLYLSSSLEEIENNRRWTWNRRHSLIRTPILVPWNRLECGEAKFPLQQYVRFVVPSNKAIFFVPRETANLLLDRVGRHVPSP